jgi:hypothetical protein
MRLPAREALAIEQELPAFCSLFGTKCIGTVLRTGKPRGYYGSADCYDSHKFSIQNSGTAH